LDNDLTPEAAGKGWRREAGWSVLPRTAQRVAEALRAEGGVACTSDLSFVLAVRAQLAVAVDSAW